MFLGHYGVALAAKRVAPKVSLGTLFLAVQLPDLLWPVLLLVGVERVRVEPGITAVNPLNFEHYPYTHSLLGAIVQGLVIGVVYLLVRGQPRGAVVLGLGAVSHWLLDFVVHIPDLPLAPGLAERFGLGLWNALAATLVVEFALFGIGLWAYARSSASRNWVGRYAFWVLIVLLAITYISNAFGPAPASANAVAVVGLIGGWLVVLWAYWAGTYRTTG